MKRFLNIQEALNAVKYLADFYKDTITITNIQANEGINKYGYFIDMTANIVSLHFLTLLAKETGDSNPVITPLDNECVQIGTYITINGSDE